MWYLKLFNVTRNCKIHIYVFILNLVYNCKKIFTLCNVTENICRRTMLLRFSIVHLVLYYEYRTKYIKYQSCCFLGFQKIFSEPTFGITIYPLPVIPSDYFLEGIFSHSVTGQPTSFMLLELYFSDSCYLYQCF